MKNKIIEKYFPGFGFNEISFDVTPNYNHKELYRLFTILAVFVVVGVVYRKINKEKVEE